MLPTSVIEEESGKSKSNDVTDNSAESLRKRNDRVMQDKTRQDKTRQDKTRQDKTRQDKTRPTRQDQDQDKTRPRPRQDNKTTRQDNKTRQDKTRQDKTRSTTPSQGRGRITWRSKSRVVPSNCYIESAGRYDADCRCLRQKRSERETNKRTSVRSRQLRAGWLSSGHSSQLSPDCPPLNATWWR